MASGGTVSWDEAISNLKAMFPTKGDAELNAALESTGASRVAGGVLGGGGAMGLATPTTPHRGVKPTQRGGGQRSKRLACRPAGWQFDRSSGS